MKQKIISLCVAALLSIAHAYCGVKLTVPEVTIAPGSTSNVFIYFDLGTNAYTAYQMDITYPEGISSVKGDDGNPVFIKGDVYDADHSVSSIYTTKGLDRFQCFSVNSLPIKAQSGLLLRLRITAQKSLAEGTYQAAISPIEFVQTDATPDRPEAITFNITVSKSVVLDENSTIAPDAASGVNVRMLRTIKANEWSTICLPFAMTSQQVNTAFGNDVQLADFYGYEATEDNDDNVIGINVKFKDVIPAAIQENHPYIIKVSKPITEFSVDGANINPEENLTIAAVKRTSRKWSEMTGTYVANTTLAENVLFLNGNKFWYSAGKTTMKAFRAYFDFYDVLAEVENANARIIMSIGDSETTGIDNLCDDTDNDTSYVDMKGRKMKKPSKGVFLKDGKKYVK